MSRGGYEMTSSEGGVCLINGIAQCSSACVLLSKKKNGKEPGFARHGETRYPIVVYVTS